jgi:hypothetical protein
MKTIFVLLTTTALVAGVTSAVAADFQASDEATANELSHRGDWGYAGAYNSVRTPSRARNNYGGAYNSVVVPGDPRNGFREIPHPMIDFQAGGGN